MQFAARVLSCNLPLEFSRAICCAGCESYLVQFEARVLSCDLLRMFSRVTCCACSLVAYTLVPLVLHMLCSRASCCVRACTCFLLCMCSHAACSRDLCNLCVLIGCAIRLVILRNPSQCFRKRDRNGLFLEAQTRQRVGSPFLNQTLEFSKGTLKRGSKNRL